MANAPGGHPAAVASWDADAAAFFARCGLPPPARLRCDDYARRRFPGLNVRPVPVQGFCSYTLLAGPDAVLQFRPARHRLDADVLGRARAVYGDWVPATEPLGPLGSGEPGPDPGSDLHVYEMARLPGVPLSELGPADEALARDLATFFARGFHRAVTASDPALAAHKGRIGRSLGARLLVLHAGLPSRFRAEASAALRALPAVEALPWALTHGDLVPGNVMVRTAGSPRLAGLLDWAEAEFLPFGVGLYGVDELLADAGARAAFWAELAARIPELAADARLRATVEAARRLGVLLWHGFAFDDGSLDRVVEVGRDDGEIRRLDRLLLGRDTSPSPSPSLSPSRSPSPPGSPQRTSGLAAVLRQAWLYAASVLWECLRGCSRFVSAAFGSGYRRALTRS